MTKPKASASAGEDEAVVEDDSIVAEAEDEQVAPYEARVIDPEPEEPETEETQPEVPEGQVAIRYVGAADLFEHGAYQFRGGQPVIVPSRVAEELLTYPFERFERA